MAVLAQRTLLVRWPAAAAGWPVIAALFTAHWAMLVFDLLHPDRFLNADRALGRIAVIEGFGEALRDGQAIAYLTAHGVVGDWLVQGLVYLAGGQYLVIALQVVLALASVFWVREIAERLGLPQRQASAAALLYGLLPHTLVLPHQLAAEAVFSPLVVLSFRLSVSRPAGFALGLATLVRPLTLLWPFVAAALQPVRAQRSVYVAAALAPVLAWMTCVYVATGEFSMGRSGHDVGANLYQRMQRMGATLPEAERPAARPAGATKATIGEYIAFAAAHPVVTAAHGLRDLAAMGAKSGLERLTLDYLDLFPDLRKSLQSGSGGWRTRVEQGGALATFIQLVRTEPGLVVTSTVASVVFIVLMALALAGAIALRRNAQGLVLAGFVVYVFVTAQAVDAAQSRHRAPAEFALCILALAGWSRLTRRSRHGK